MAPLGTVATNWLSLVTAILACTPCQKKTLIGPAEKPLPVTWIVSPGVPTLGVKSSMTGPCPSAAPLYPTINAHISPGKKPNSCRFRSLSQLLNRKMLLISAEFTSEVLLASPCKSNDD